MNIDECTSWEEAVNHLLNGKMGEYFVNPGAKITIQKVNGSKCIGINQHGSDEWVYKTPAIAIKDLNTNFEF